MKEVTKIESEYLHRNVSVGIIVPDKVEKIVVLLHGRDGSFKVQSSDYYDLRNKGWAFREK